MAGLTLCLVIDTSGSMGEAAPPPDAAEDQGFSVLDVVKHSALTIVESMGPQDRLAVVQFCSMASRVLDVTAMTAEGKRAAGAAIQRLQPQDMTALWEGLELGISTLRDHTTQADAANTPHIILLTDGQPNRDPPGGAVVHLRALQQKESEAARRLPQIHTFGFGYNTDRNLLDQLARLGGGFYGFIPDSGMIGTVFVSTAAWLRHPPPSPLPQPSPAASCFTEAVARLSASRTAVSLDVTRATLAGHARKGDPTAAAFLENWDDQVAKAVSTPDWHGRWGQPYLLSLARAVELQISANFRDPAGRPFETPAFLAERERVEDLFLQLPPMQPSRANRCPAAPRGSGPPTPPPSMSPYMDRCGGCFVGNLRCRRSSEKGGRGRPLPASDLRRGDVVWALHPTAGWGWAEVELVMRSRPGPVLLRSTTAAVDGTDGGCLITPWHPVLDEAAAEWRFPTQWTARFREQQQQQQQPGAAADCWVYSTVLRPPAGETTRPVGVLVGGTVCAAMAHGNQTDAVLKHAFFGTEEVTLELQRGAHALTGVATVLAFLRSGVGDRAAGDDRIVGLAFE